MDTRVRGLGTPRTAEGKLRSPSLGGQAIDRPRLLRTLDSCLDRDGAFAMLSAPAGFGKTYLLAQWAAGAAARGILVGWCGLTPDDREPHVLWNTVLDSLIEATHSRESELAIDLAAVIPDMDPIGHPCFLAQVFAALAAFERPIVIVVDNTELLEHSASEFEFVQLLRAMPDNVHVAFATRSPLQTQTARVSGRLIELAADALSFTSAEVVELFANRGTTQSDLDRIISEAEGWPAALSLAVLQVEREESLSDALPTLHDSSELYDYLRSEVFDDLTDREREVLLTMGVTPLTTPELVDQLCGGHFGAATLRKLAADNHLIYRVSTDPDGRIWYRVQRLFGAFLREQLREQSPARLLAVTETAVKWHAVNGDAFVALHLAIDPPNSCLVDAVLRQRGYQVIGDGHSVELLALMPPSTSEALRGPFSRLMMAYAAVASGRPDRAEEFLAAPHIDELGVDDLLEWDWLNYLVQLHLGLAAGRDVGATSSGWPAASLDRLPAPLQLAVRLTEGLADARSGRVLLANESLRAALASAENDEDLSGMVRSTIGLAGAAAVACDFRLAQALSQRAIALAQRSTTEDQSEPLAIAHLLATWSFQELLDRESARAHASLAMSFAESHGEQNLLLQVRHIFNDAHFDLLEQKRRIAQEFVTAWPPPYLTGTANAAVVASLLSGMRMSAHLGEPRWSERLLDCARQILGEQVDWQVAYALHLLTTGRDDSARTVIAPLIDSGAYREVGLASVLMCSIDGVLKARANNAYQAHAATYRALELADATGGYLEMTRADLPTMTRILSAGSGRFGPHEHVARLLLAPNTDERVASSGLLTARERQILGELRTLRTVDEIARDLLLSVNTVKTHMRGIYRKLDVTSRRQAVIKAERNGLI